MSRSLYSLCALGAPCFAEHIECACFTCRILRPHLKTALVVQSTSEKLVTESQIPIVVAAAAKKQKNKILSFIAIGVSSAAKKRGKACAKPLTAQEKIIASRQMVHRPSRRVGPYQELLQDVIDGGVDQVTQKIIDYHVEGSSPADEIYLWDALKSTKTGSIFEAVRPWATLVVRSFRAVTADVHAQATYIV